MRLMLDLALNNTGAPISLKDVARRQEISDKYLEHVCELLPALALVGVRLSGTHRQHRVQQQHAVLCPVGQFAVLAGVVDAHIVLDLLEDVHQRRRRSHAFPHGKAVP